MKMRKEYCDARQRDFSLRKANNRPSSGVENQLLFTGFDQRGRAEAIRTRLRCAGTKKSDTDGLSTSGSSGKKPENDGENRYFGLHVDLVT